MTARRRPRSHGAPNARRRSAVLNRTAELVRAHFRRNRLDVAPLKVLASTLGVTEATLRAAAARHHDLGICGDGVTEHLWWLPPAPLATAFQPVMLDGQLALRLAAADPDAPALHISGRHLGPAPLAELDLPELQRMGVGPLGYTIARLLLMAENWLATSTRSGTRTLFELIARTWYSSPGPVWSCGRLHIHHGLPAHPTVTELEIVVWADGRGALHLVNLYPAGTHRSVFDAEDPT